MSRLMISHRRPPLVQGNVELPCHAVRDAPSGDLRGSPCHHARCPHQPALRVRHPPRAAHGHRNQLCVLPYAWLQAPVSEPVCCFKHDGDGTAGKVTPWEGVQGALCSVFTVCVHAASEGTHIPEEVELWPAMSWDEGVAAGFPHHGYEHIFAGKKVASSRPGLRLHPGLRLSRFAAC